LGMLSMGIYGRMGVIRKYIINTVFFAI
jgi:hypothetical protein